MNLATIAFWKKKDSSSLESERIIPLPPSLSSPTSVVHAESEEEVQKAKDSLKVLRLERQIIGAALTTIFESETKGIISSAERVRLVDKYKVDLNQLEKAIQERQRVVELYDLENSRQELIRDFNTRMFEVEEKMKRLNAGNSAPDSQVSGIVSVELPPEKKSVPPISDAEKRVEQIRDEILKAMDRLEQIESEG